MNLNHNIYNLIIYNINKYYKKWLSYKYNTININNNNYYILLFILIFINVVQSIPIINTNKGGKFQI